MSLENLTFHYYQKVKVLLKQGSFNRKVRQPLLSPYSTYWEVFTKNETIIRDSLESLTCPQNHELKLLQKYRSFDYVTYTVPVFRGGSGSATSKMELFVKVVNGLQPLPIFTQSSTLCRQSSILYKEWYLDPLLVLMRSFEHFHCF